MNQIRLTLIISIVALCFVSSIALAMDPGNRDTVRVARVNTNAGQNVAVPVTLYNDERIGGFSLGVKWNSTDVICDSVSFIGTRLSPATQQIFTIDSTLLTVLVGMADLTGNHGLSSGNGLIYTMWFHVIVGAPDQFVDLDSTFVPPAGPFILSPTIGPTISPEFKIGQIKVGNPLLPPVIVLSQSSFTFSALVGGGNPVSQVQNITNGGQAPLNWTATKLATWLLPSPMSGTAPTAMLISIDVSGLIAGTYIDTIRITAPGATNSPRKFPVTLQLTVPPPTIKLTPDSFYFQCLQNGPNPANQNLSITNIGQGTLNWTATEGATWLNLSSYSGTAPSNVTVSADNTGLVAGVYKDSIIVSDPTATNNPRTAKVVFEVFSAFPVIAHAPDSIFAAGSDTQNPYPRTMQIINNGGGVMNWHVTKTKPWLTFDVDTGSTVQGTPSTVTLFFNRNLTDFGVQYDTVTIASSNAINSPQIMKVNFWKMETPQSFTLSTSNLAFSQVECGSLQGIQPQAFSITATVEAPLLHWTTSHNQPWLTVTPSTGPHDATVLVSVDVTGLAPGNYNDTITVSSAVSIDPPKTIAVAFSVSPTTGTPQLGLTADSLVYIFAYTAVGSSAQTLTVYNVPGGCLNWTAVTDTSWLSTAPTSGTTTDSVVVRGDAVGLSLGRHEGKVVFTSPSAVNSPKELPVALWVYTFGDANCNGIVNVSDAVYIIAWIFGGGPDPCPFPITGDVNCDRQTNISDAVWLINWIFNHGEPPCFY